MDKKIQGALLFVLAVFIFMLGSKYGDVLVHMDEPEAQELIIEGEPPENTASKKATESKPEKEETKDIYVHVAGAVKRPGLYRMQGEARINDLLKLAEPLPQADINRLNLAERLRDGEKLTVPTMGENFSGAENSNTSNAGSSSSDIPSSDKLININTAGAQELDSLPGIGPAYAQRIIQYREEHGPFEKPEDIQDVQGIGTKKYEDLKERICVD